MLTGHTTEADLLAAFDAGADDYVKKPASEAELLARVKAGCRLIESERRLSAPLVQVHQLSVTDSLIGLDNRRYLNEQLPREIERAHRYARPLSIIMADLDAFKVLIDTHGHATRESSKCFARLAFASIRSSSDWMARYGKEFVLVLPETTLTEATRVAEKVRTQCASTPMDSPSGQRRVTASFGVTTAPLPPMPPIIMEALLRHCDEALYRSKRAGRDCVTVASEF
jgi:two-component system cell cycle response regulator